MSRPHTKQIKQQLFLNCGRVDMYDMEAYSKKSLQLHHDPPFKYTHHTIYEESFLLSANNHQELHYIEYKDPEEYERRMAIIRGNKKILEKTNKRQG